MQVQQLSQNIWLKYCNVSHVNKVFILGHQVFSPDAKFYIMNYFRREREEREREREREPREGAGEEGRH